jgi:hypothetical protein
MMRGIGSQNKTAGSPASGTPRAISVSTIAPTGIEPVSDSKSWLVDLM